MENGIHLIKKKNCQSCRDANGGASRPPPFQGVGTGKVTSFMPGEGRRDGRGAIACNARCGGESRDGREWAGVFSFFIKLKIYINTPLFYEKFHLQQELDSK